MHPWPVAPGRGAWGLPVVAEPADSDTEGPGPGPEGPGAVGGGGRMPAESEGFGPLAAATA